MAAKQQKQKKTHTGRDEHDVDLDRPLVAALGRLDLQHDLVALERRAVDLGAQLELHPLLLQCALEVAANLGVHGRHDHVSVLDDRDVGAEALVHRAHLEADVAAADDDHRAGHLLSGGGGGGWVGGLESRW